MLPLVLAAVGIVVSIGGSLLVRVKEGGDPQRGLNLGEFGSAGVMAVLSYFIILFMLPEEWIALDPVSDRFVAYSATGVFFAVVIGLAAGVLIGLITEYYCSTKNKPTYNIAFTGRTTSHDPRSRSRAPAEEGDPAPEQWLCETGREWCGSGQTWSDGS